jgi:hypothetical protein
LKDLTIVVPGIRPNLWSRVYSSTLYSIGDYTFDIIFVGPINSQEFCGNSDVSFVQSYSCPSRCTQMGALLANSKFICWFSDDCVFLPDRLKECLDILVNSSHKDILAMRYYEGINFSGNDKTHPPEYWNTSYHDALKLPGIPPHYKVATMGIMNLQYYYELGGLDCHYEHLNMCLHDLAFRIQNDGGEVIISPHTVINADFDPNEQSIERKPVIEAYHKNDSSLFTEFYSKPYNPSHIKIDYNNWKSVDSIWKRRFNV